MENHIYLIKLRHYRKFTEFLGARLDALTEINQRHQKVLSISLDESALSSKELNALKKAQQDLLFLLETDEV